MMADRADSHGIGKHSDTEMIEAISDDLEAIDALLADIPGAYLFGNSPTSYDAALFGSINGIIYSPFKHPVHQKARSLARLVAFCDSIRGRYFPSGGKFPNHGSSAAP